MMVSNKVCENGGEHVGLLPATNDDHGGVIVNIEEAMDAKVFVTLLRDSISHGGNRLLFLIDPLYNK